MRFSPLALLRPGVVAIWWIYKKKRKRKKYLLFILQLSHPSINPHKLQKKTKKKTGAFLLGDVLPPCICVAVVTKHTWFLLGFFSPSAPPSPSFYCLKKTGLIKDDAPLGSSCALTWNTCVASSSRSSALREYSWPVEGWMPMEESLSGMEYLCVVGVRAGGGENNIVLVMQNIRQTQNKQTKSVTITKWPRCLTWCFF